MRNVCGVAHHICGKKGRKHCEYSVGLLALLVSVLLFPAAVLDLTELDTANTNNESGYNREWPKIDNGLSSKIRK